MTTPSLRRAGATVIGVALLGKGFGFLREAVVAAVFGTTYAVDLYLAALVVPMVAATAITYTVPNAFVPLFTPASADKARARAVAWGLLGAMTLLSLVICLFGRPMAALVASGFSESARAEVSSLVCLAAWVIPLSTVEALGRSHLLARKRFLGPGLAYLWQSAAIIIAAIVWSEHGAHALMWGLVVGTALAAGWNLILILMGRAKGAVDAPGEPVQNQSSGIGRWVLAVLVVDAMGQLFTVMDRHFGSFLPSGSIAALQYANLVAFLPYSIVGVGLSTAIFPYLSDSVASGNDADVEAILDRAVRWSLFGVIPIVVWLIVFREQTVRILFERGAFDARSRELTATVLAAFSIGLVPNVLAAVGSRVFYVTRRWAPLFLGAMAGVATKALCGWWWTRSAGILGLALATAAGLIVWLVPLLFGLRFWIRRDRAAEWGWLAIQTAVLVGTPAVLISYGLPILTSAADRLSFGYSTFTLALGIIGGAGMLLFLGRRLRIREVEVAISELRRVTSQWRH